LPQHPRGKARLGQPLDAVAAGLNVALCLVLINMMRQIARAQSTAPYEETFA